MNPTTPRKGHGFLKRIKELLGQRSLPNWAAGLLGTVTMLLAFVSYRAQARAEHRGEMLQQLGSAEAEIDKMVYSDPASRGRVDTVLKLYTEALNDSRLWIDSSTRDLLRKTPFEQADQRVFRELAVQHRLAKLDADASAIDGEVKALSHALDDANAQMIHLRKEINDFPPQSNWNPGSGSRPPTGLQLASLSIIVADMNSRKAQLLSKQHEATSTLQGAEEAVLAKLNDARTDFAAKLELPATTLTRKEVRDRRPYPKPATSEDTPPGGV